MIRRCLDKSVAKNFYKNVIHVKFYSAKPKQALKATDFIRIEEAHGVREITLNNPQTCNSLSKDMIAHLKEAIEKKQDDIKLRAIVLSAKGKTWSSGHNLKEISKVMQEASAKAKEMESKKECEAKAKAMELERKLKEECESKALAKECEAKLKELCEAKACAEECKCQLKELCEAAVEAKDCEAKLKAECAAKAKAKECEAILKNLSEENDKFQECEAKLKADCLAKEKAKKCEAEAKLKEECEAKAKAKEDVAKAKANTFAQLFELIQTIIKSPVPVIAKVDGIAAAAGLQLALSCDIVFCTKRSQFSTPAIHIGLFCSTPGVAISRLIPRTQALHMLFTGLPITADEAYAMGLVSKVVPDLMIDEAVEDFTMVLKKSSRAVVAHGKSTFYKTLDLPLEKAYAIACEAMVKNLEIPDAQEGVVSFFKKRKPKWTHKNA